MKIGEKLRYGRVTEFPPTTPNVEGMTNWWAATLSSIDGAARVKLDAGINAPALIGGPSPRVPFLAIRSSPHKAGSDVTPWEDVQRPDEGYVRYFGDNKPGGPVWAHETLGNRRMLAAWRQHVDGDEQVRMVAPPVLVFQGFTHAGRPKGQVVFNGVGVIDRAELIVQADPRFAQTFTNYRFDLTVLDLAKENDTLDWRWLDARRDQRVNYSDALRLAPNSWREWVRLGPSALERNRRHVLQARIVSDDTQRPTPGSAEHAILSSIYEYYTGRKHRFEALADFVTGRVLESQGMRYQAGWITRSSADGGVDFVGRIDLDPAGGFVSSCTQLSGW